MKLAHVRTEQGLALRLQAEAVLPGMLQRATSLCRLLLSPRWRACCLGSSTPVKVCSNGLRLCNACCALDHDMRTVFP